MVSPYQRPVGMKYDEFQKQVRRDKRSARYEAVRTLYEQGLSQHASHNVAKKVLDWEYVREILRIHLRTRLADQHQAQPGPTSLSHEGSIPQGPGAFHAQIIPSEPQVPGGDRHV